MVAALHVEAAMSPHARPEEPDRAADRPVAVPGEPSMRLVRPYALTGGRTRSGAVDLAIESLIVTNAKGRAAAPGLQHELRTIAGLCLDPISVAEVSAHLGVPRGVARVLVSDMSEQGLVDVQQGQAERPNQALLERVLHGIRDL
jgi:uncharacterized protein DUF742